jgi:hypothetical protein
VPPLVILTGKNVSPQWIPKDLNESFYFSASEKGWTSMTIREEWLYKVFEPFTREKARGRKRLLICDDHNSHVSSKFIRVAIDNDIEVILMPPHSSHLLQPLDIGIFGPFKTHIRKELDKYFRIRIARMQKAE